MTNELMVAAKVVAEGPQVVQLVCCKCASCIWIGISQGVIAAFAVISGVIALFRYVGDKKRMSPKLVLRFEDNDRFCVLGDASVEKGGVGKQQTFRLLLENIGACPAKECKVRVSNVIIVSGKEHVEAHLSDGGNRLLEMREANWPAEIGNGESVELELCRIAANKDDPKGSDPKRMSSIGDDAVLHVLNKGGVLNSFLPHQNHLKIEIKLVASLFAPKTYVFDIKWKGKTVAAIGTELSYSVNFKEK